MSDLFNAYPFPECSGDNVFSGNPLTRDSEHLSQEDLERARVHEEAVVCLFHQGDPVLFYNGDDNALPYCALNGALELTHDPDTLIYLGQDDTGPVLAATIPDDAALPAGAKTLPIRDAIMSGHLRNRDIAMMGHGFSLLKWHENHRFCSRCGTQSAMTQGGYRRQCPSCGATHFPRLDPVTIMLVTDGERILLGRQPQFLPGMYSCLAGFVEPGESLEEAVRREVLEEAGVTIGTVRYLSSQPWPFPYTLMVGCIAEALTTDIDMDVTELEDCRWFTRDELGPMLAREGELKAPPPMAIAHQLIRKVYELTDPEQTHG